MMYAVHSDTVIGKKNSLTHKEWYVNIYSQIYGFKDSSAQIEMQRSYTITVAKMLNIFDIDTIKYIDVQDRQKYKAASEKFLSIYRYCVYRHTVIWIDYWLV